jgi:multidrug efflux pump subunit AcrB
MLTVAMLMGLTINMISLFGMILVVGILVDDGIVIAENIFAHYQRGKSPEQAAVDGTLEVAGSVFTSVLTTIVAFMPLLLLNTGGLEFMKEMAVVVVLSLSISLLEAFFILPAHMASHHVLRPDHHKTENPIRKALDQFFNFTRDRLYIPALRHVILYRYVYFWVPVVFIMVVLGAFKGEVIRGVFFPQIPFDSFNVDIAFKAGTREQAVMERLSAFEAKAWELENELKTEFGDTVGFIAYISKNLGKTNDNAEVGSHAGNLNILLKEVDKKAINSDEVSQRLRRKLGDQPDLEKFRVGGFNRFGKPVSFSLFARDPNVLQAATEELKARLAEYSSLRDITDNAKLGRREIQLELKDKAKILGFTHGEIATQVRQAFFGEEAQRIQSGNDELRVWVRLPDSDKATLDNLDKLKIRRGSEEFPLIELASYQIQRGLVDIKHFQGQREIVVEAELTDLSAPVPSIVSNIESTILQPMLEKYPGFSYGSGGQQRNLQKTSQAASTTVPLALLIIVLLITLTFRSLPQAILVMLMVPIGVYSAILGHGIVGKPFSILSVWGTLALSGVIINDTVVFLDKFNQNLRSGMSFYDAVLDTGRSRFRAIILTSLTTVAGLYPLILEKSFQAQFLIPMAVSMAYGVLLGTFFTLLIFPTLVYALNDLRRLLILTAAALKYWILGSRTELELPKREEVEPSVVEEKRLSASKLV